MLLPACLALFAIGLLHHETWHPDTIVSGQLYAWAAGRPYTIFPEEEDATADRGKLRAVARAMQDAVPPGRPILVRLDTPFLLDFRRNPIWVMDHPGLCGPPPGAPQPATVSAWTRYLRSAGVAFVAYAYGDQAGESPQHDALFLSDTGPSYYQQRLTTETAAVQAVLLKLRANTQVIYDDGTRYVAALGDRTTAQGTGKASPKSSAGS
jgi:hypothetical protein